MDQIVQLKSKENKNKSILLSFLFHVILLLLLLMPCLHYFDPPRENQSIIIAIGIPEVEAVPAKSNTNEIVEEIQPTPSSTAPTSKPSPSQPSPAKAIPNAVTEEKSPVVAEKKPSKAELEAQAERERIEDEKQKAAEEARKKEQAKSKFGSLFNKNNETDNSSGQGDPISTPDASALEGISEGFGKTGKGLQTRSIIYQPTIEDNTQKTGKVVINICVNGSGKVISANFTQKGSTTTDIYLINLAKENARKYLFSKSEITEQCGEIIIDFRLR